MRKGQFLSKVMKQKEFNHIKQMINKLKHPQQIDMMWFFFNKKFGQDQKINSQNNRWLSHPRTCLESCRWSFLQKSRYLVSSAMKAMSCHPTSSKGFRLNQQLDLCFEWSGVTWHQSGSCRESVCEVARLGTVSLQPRKSRPSSQRTSLITLHLWHLALELT